jgi:hypothetical protein
MLARVVNIEGWLVIHCEDFILMQYGTSVVMFVTCTLRNVMLVPSIATPGDDVPYYERGKLDLVSGRNFTYYHGYILDDVLNTGMLPGKFTDWLFFALTRDGIKN